MVPTTYYPLPITWTKKSPGRGGAARGRKEEVEVLVSSSDIGSARPRPSEPKALTLYNQYLATLRPESNDSSCHVNAHSVARFSFSVIDRTRKGVSPQ